MDNSKAQRRTGRSHVAAAMTGAAVILWIIGAGSPWLLGSSLLLAYYWISATQRRGQ